MSDGWVARHACAGCGGTGVETRSETVTIRIPPDELTRARTLAAKRGLRYQTYLKMLLHEALDAEEKKLAS